MTGVDRPISFVLGGIDQGVRNVGGRGGAAEGPERLLAGLEDAGHVPADARVERVQVGNAAESLEADLDALSGAVQDALEAGRFPIVFGGDHGTTYAVVRGAARALARTGVVYLDVHLDLRAFEPEHTSGSSFRRLLEEGWIEPDHVHPIGIQRPATAEARKRADWDALTGWAKDHHVSWVSLEEAREAGLADLVRGRMRADVSWCVSLDTDVLDERFAPGVSAPGEGRLTPEQVRVALTAALERGHALDVVEYAPDLDEDERTLETLVDVLGPILTG